MKATITFLTILFGVALSGFAQTSVMDFYDAKTKAHRKQMMNNGVDMKDTPFTIKTKDIKNGFIAYELPLVEGFEEMAYYIPAQGAKFVAVVSFGCGPACEAGLPTFYELKDRVLVDQTNKYLTEKTRAEIEKGLEDARAKIKPADEETLLGQWVKVPQQGTTIQIGFMEDGGVSDGKFHIIYELVYTKATGTFSLSRKQLSN